MTQFINVEIDVDKAKGFIIAMIWKNNLPYLIRKHYHSRMIGNAEYRIIEEDISRLIREESDPKVIALLLNYVGCDFVTGV